MGCNSSKVEDLEPVALCRDRSILLESAIRHRYSLANAHLSYLRSLSSIGIALQRFFETISPPPPPPPPPPPHLPPQQKPDSNSTTHHQIPPAETDSDSGSGSDISTPSHDHQVDGEGGGRGETLGPNSDGHSYYYVNRMQSRGGAPAAAYRWQSPETGRVEEAAASSMNPNGFGYPSSSSYSYQYPNQGSYPYVYYTPYFNPYAHSNYGGAFGGGGYYGASSSLPSQLPPQFDRYSYLQASGPAPASPAPAPGFASPSRATPPPPSPRVVEWEFLDPFYPYERYYREAYTPSRDSEELREEEGIPDLEDDDGEQEVVKHVKKEEESAVDGSGGDSEEHMADETEGETEVEGDEALGGFNLNSAGEDEIVANEENCQGGGGSAGAVENAGGSEPPEVADVVREIKAQFDRASESGNEVSKLLEVGRLPYRGRNAVYKVPSKTLDVVSPPFSVVSSRTSTSRSMESASSSERDAFLSFSVDEYIEVYSRNLSSILEKLFIWEKKLYEEVKAEEKLRIIYDRKRRQLKHLDDKGAEPHKIESTLIFVRKLSMKLRIGIQVVDSISSKINKLRDEELWLQINELIHGLGRMWKVMLECHHSQCRVISEAKNLDSIAPGGLLIDAHKEATMLLELELLNWLSSFYAWISAQKAYIKALNGWLLKCLHFVPEETDDGLAPSSPGRIGAPPVFVICNQWSQALERLSEKEVFTAVQTFSMCIHRLWEQYNEEQHKRMMANSNMEKRLRAIESDDQKVQKALDSVNKKLVMVSEESGTPLLGQLMHRSDTTDVSSLQLSLKQVFEAMDKFSVESMEVYEELQKRSEEQLAAESAKMEGPRDRVADEENPAN